MSSASAALDRASYRFGRYETLFRVGAGGMAEVFAARLCGEAGFERQVAIKRLLPHLAADPQHVARFFDEARIAACIRHPHVVQTLDLERSDEGDPFLVLELVVGCSLEGLLRTGERPPLRVLLSWLVQVAEGLHAAHSARAPGGEPLALVHRDVSPHNVLLGLDGDARIADFGVAHAAALKWAHSAPGELHGKRAYFAPEQALGGALDARTDVFALGVVAWEAVTGRRLFHAEHPAAVIERVRALPIVPPHQLEPHVPAALSHAIMWALARAPSARPASARHFAHALASAHAELGGSPDARERARYVRAALPDCWRGLARCAEPGTMTAAAPPSPRRALRVARLTAAAAVACGAWLSVGQAGTARVGLPPPYTVVRVPTVTRAATVREPAPAPPAVEEAAESPPIPARGVTRAAPRRRAPAALIHEKAPPALPWGWRS